MLAASGAGRIPHLSRTVTSYPPSSSIQSAVDMPKIPVSTGLSRGLFEVDSLRTRADDHHVDLGCGRHGWARWVFLKYAVMYRPSGEKRSCCESAMGAFCSCWILESEAIREV